MTTTLPTKHQVGDRVDIHRKGRRVPGRISSVHTSDCGVEYVIRIDSTDGGMGVVLNIWTTSGHSSFMTPAEGTR